jgi:hypothetical protein
VNARSFFRPATFLASCAVFACASRPARGPLIGDEQWLVVGVPPEREADALIESMARHGRTLVLRLRGIHYTALEFADAEGATAAVRVVTRRGIALALDAHAGDVWRPARAWRLLPSPLEAGGGDARAEELVLIEERVAAREACVRVYRVRESGEVVAEARPVDPGGRPACATEDAPASIPE